MAQTSETYDQWLKKSTEVAFEKGNKVKKKAKKKPAKLNWPGTEEEKKKK